METENINSESLILLAQRKPQCLIIFWKHSPFFDRRLPDFIYHLYKDMWLVRLPHLAVASLQKILVRCKAIMHAHLSSGALGQVLPPTSGYVIACNDKSTEKYVEVHVHFEAIMRAASPSYVSY